MNLEPDEWKRHDEQEKKEREREKKNIRTF